MVLVGVRGVSVCVCIDAPAIRRNWRSTYDKDEQRLYHAQQKAATFRCTYHLMNSPLPITLISSPDDPLT